MSEHGLSQRYLARCSAAGAVDGGDLELVLGQIVAAARAAWPTVHLETEALIDSLAERVGAGGLATVRASDLYLAAACARQDPEALRTFEQAYAKDLAAAYARVRPPGHSLDDVMQLLREKLFVGGKILEYAGTGPLGSWLRVVMMRLLLNLATRGPKERPADAPLELMLEDMVDSPEIDLLKLTYRDAARAAFAEAAGGLSARQRNLLRAALVDGRSVDEIGALYNIHRATAARWVAAARDELLSEFQRAMERRLGITEQEFVSILRLVRSQLDLSLSHVFDER